MLGASNKTGTSLSFGLNPEVVLVSIVVMVFSRLIWDLSSDKISGIVVIPKAPTSDRTMGKVPVEV